MPPADPTDPALAEALHRLGRQVPSLSFVASIVDALREAAGAERAFLFRFRRGGGFRVLAGRDRDREDIALPQGRMSHYAVRCLEKEGRAVVVPDARVDRRYRSEEAQAAKRPARSILVLPLVIEGELTGGVYLDHRFQELPADAAAHDAVRCRLGLVGAALHLRELRARLRWAEKRYVSERRRARVAGGAPPVPDPEADPPARPARDSRAVEEFHGFVSAHPGCQAVFDAIRQLGGSEIPVLLCGETGTGKSLLARAVHEASTRSGAPFVTLACGAVPDTLAESELLGHQRGAFTGAEQDRDGVFAQADGGTLLLDEVGDLSAGLQTKLLRVLEEGALRPLGAAAERPVDVRVVSTTSRDLEGCVREGHFRRDLYYRLKGVVIEIPPLRARPEDVEVLARRFLKRYTRDDPPPRLAQDALERLRSRAWPGNVRELENEMRRLASLGHLEVGTADLAGPGDDPSREHGSGAARTVSLDEVMARAERSAVLEALERAGGNKSRAAHHLGITRKALYRRLRKYGLAPEHPRDGG